MIAGLRGNRVPYIGYKRATVDPTLLYLYENLTKGEQRRVKRISKGLDETRYEYLDEVLIDFENAFHFSKDILDKGLITGMSHKELTMLMMLFGIGVARREPDEISLVSGDRVDYIVSMANNFRENYSETIDVIYDVVMQYLSNENNKEKQVSL